MKYFSPCLDDPMFFIKKDDSKDNSEPYLLSLPIGWCEVRDNYEWIDLFSQTCNTPRQGWKVHISATLDNSNKVLDIVSKTCFQCNVEFKHLVSQKRFKERNGKLMDRGYSGKFITCYPQESQLELFLKILESQLKKYKGPYILSDKRWKAGPIFLRYGVFRSARKDENYSSNISMLTINGKDVKDKRLPKFIVPKGLEIPKFLQSWLNKNNDESNNEMPFSVSSAIKFTNCGGVYTGRLNATNQKIIVKEARPFTGIEDNNVCATDKLAMENRALKNLKNIPEVPNSYWFGKLWENSFLAIEKVEGVPLNRWVTKNYPIYAKKFDGVTNYLQRIFMIISNLMGVVNAAHSKGVFHQDIHLGNILIDLKDNIKLIDWGEVVFQDDKRDFQRIAAPGFAFWGKGKPSEIDWYGIYQIANFLFYPVIIQSDLVYGYVHQTQDAGKNLFTQLGYPQSEIRKYMRLLSILNEKFNHISKSNERVLKPVKNDSQEFDDIDKLGKGLLKGLFPIKRNWESTNSKRFFPAHYYGIDINDGISFSDLAIIWSYKKLEKALGVSAKSSLSIKINRLTDLLIEKKINELKNNNFEHNGLFDGTSGSLWLLYRLGSKKNASKIFNKQFKKMVSNVSKFNIYSGLAGILLVGIIFSKAGLLDHITNDQLLTEIKKFGIKYMNSPENFIKVGKASRMSNDPYDQESGLFYGHAGIGWLFAQAYRLDGNPLYRQCLNKAIIEELKGFETDSIGSLQYVQGKRLLPYLSIGSAGLGVLMSENIDLLNLGLNNKMKKIYRALDANMCVFPGLANGFMGLKIGQIELNTLLHNEEKDKLVKSLLKGLKVYLIKIGNGLCIAGDSGMRLSTDVFSGSAGIALGLASVKDGNFYLLPQIDKREN